MPSGAGIRKRERQREKHVAAIKKLERQIAEMSGGNGSIAAAPRRGRKPGRKKGYKLSAATRRKMSEAAKRRYAKAGTTSKPTQEAKPKAKRRALSSETRAKMAAAAKARWAKVKGIAEAKAE